jgi:hypothetical protein
VLIELIDPSEIKKEGGSPGLGFKVPYIECGPFHKLFAVGKFI